MVDHLNIVFDLRKRKDIFFHRERNFQIEKKKTIVDQAYILNIYIDYETDLEFIHHRQSLFRGTCSGFEQL